jgi:hypothetical protein
MQELAETRLEAPMLALIGGRGCGRYGGGQPGAQQQTLVQGLRCGQLRLLLDECKAQAITPLQLTLIERRVTGEYREQCRFAGAVAPDQPEPLASQYGELRSIEERPLAEGDMRIAK